MKIIIPWIMCLLLGAGLICTNWPIIIHTCDIPPDLARATAIDGLRWIPFYAKNSKIFWKLHATRDKDSRFGETYAITDHDKLVAVLDEDDPSIRLFQDGRMTAWIPVRNRTFSNMRLFYTYATNGIETTLVDYNGDGVVDAKMTGDHLWVYKGDFVEAISTTRYDRIKCLLDGTRVIFEAGHWNSAE